MNKHVAMILIVMPLAATAQSEQLEPMAFLAGHCWTGQFSNDGPTDTHCYSWVYGGRFLRDVHVVEGREGPYCGETIYHVDAEGTVHFTYYNSLGGVSRGLMKDTPEGLFSPAGEYDGPNGTKTVLRSWLQADETGDAYTVVTERKDADTWREITDMRFDKASDLEPESAVNGACAGGAG